MSSKGTVFLTGMNEHCYNETNEHDGNSFRLYLEIDPVNITFMQHDEYDGLIVGIKGDSEIASLLRTVKQTED
ncbi:hypothetical protein KAR91_67435 [Candidatus Pacearchaeota archaeon]|nr:hypothetical protein [Candidatus Pacearchaeota archaeon]